MADEQNKPSVWLKVRALQSRGFSRAGIRFTSDWQYVRVTEEQAKTLESEPMLAVERVSESDVPNADKQAVLASQEPSQEDSAQQRALVKNAEFPLLAAAPGAEPARVIAPIVPMTPPPAPTTTNTEATANAIDDAFGNASLPKPPGATDSQTTGGSDQPPQLPPSGEGAPSTSEPESETVYGSLSDSSSPSSKKRR